MAAPHLLILDEPTNHLDIDSRRALLDALNDYDGAVILITHDRSLMELVADRLWLADAGTIKPFDGDMDDYAKFVIDRARSASRRAQAAPPPPPERAPGPAGPRISLSTLRHRLGQAERALAAAHERITVLDAALADPELFSREPARAASLGRDRARGADELATAEAAWLEAAEAVHEVEGA